LPRGDRAARQRFSVGALLFAGGAAFALQLRYVWAFTADDAFITFRYAQNWVAGHGPNFNVDGPRAEGVTSFGYLLVCAIPQLLGIDAVAFAKAIGVASALATAWLAARLARELGEGSKLAAAFAAALSLGFYATAIHAASGMETLLAAALLTALVHAHVRPGASGSEIGALSLAAGLVRPELNVAAGLLLALALSRGRAPQRAALARGAGLAYLLPGAIYFAARAAYYGHLLPIPFYEKIAGGPLFPAADSVIAFGRMLLAGGGALFLTVGTALAPRRFEPAWLAILAVMAVGLLPDPVMDFDFRYCMPAAPVAFAIAGAGFAQIAQLVAEWRPVRAPIPVLAVVAIALVAASSYEPARDALRERRAYGEALAGTHVRLGHVLADYRGTAAAAPPLLAIGDAGAIPYYSGLRVIDTYSLNDPAIAIEGRDEPAYVLDQRPDLVVVVSEQGREFHAHWANRHDGPLFEACRARGMQPAVILTFSARSFLYVMAQPGSEIARHLQRVYLQR
jgi:arabinofuranosyltransferase